MADDIDRKAFESMIEITDPFDPLFAPNTGKSVGRLNKELEGKWVEENVKMGYPPDLTPTVWKWGFKAANQFIKLATTPKIKLTAANIAALQAWSKKAGTNISNLKRMARKELATGNKRSLIKGKLKGELTKWKK